MTDCLVNVHHLQHIEANMPSEMAFMQHSLVGFLGFLHRKFCCEHIIFTCARGARGGEPPTEGRGLTTAPLEKPLG